MTLAEPRLVRLATLIAGSPHNLVSARDRADVLERHIAESLAVAVAIERLVEGGTEWLDLGTGGGLPGLALALAYPTVDWTLIDASHKKVAAVRAFAQELALPNVRVVAERAETLAQDPLHRGRASGVVARAVAPLRVLAELARGLVADGGWLVAVKGPGWESELAEAVHAIGRCRWRDPQGVRVRSAVRPTWVVTMRAVGAPPAGVPRRVGVPQRRPY